MTELILFRQAKQFRNLRLEISCYAARDTKKGDLYVLTNWSVLHLSTHRSFEISLALFVMF